MDLGLPLDTIALQSFPAVALGSIQFSRCENHIRPSRLRPLDYDPAPRQGLVRYIFLTKNTPSRRFN